MLRHKLRTFSCSIHNWYVFLCFLLKKKKRETGEIKRLHFLTNAHPAPNGGIGGPSTSLSMMQTVIGPKLLGLDVKYSYARRAKYNGNWLDGYRILPAMSWVFDVTKHERDTLYVTHDFCAAAGLWLAGKRYVFANHSQGSIVEQTLFFGHPVSCLMRRLIYTVEKTAVNNALCVLFPSLGGREAFNNSKDKAKGIDFKPGPIVYNTLFARFAEEPLRPLKKVDGTVTFLSVGNITGQKGFDRHYEFLREYLQFHNGKVRYIVKGAGPLEKEFVASMNKLATEFSNFTFIHIKKRISGENLAYLRKISDVYLMLHRVSIFDMATLEMFGDGKTAVLSKVGGNLEFNRDGNVILVEEGNYRSAAKELASVNIAEMGQKCLNVYNKYFSNQCFVSTYETLIKSLIENEKSKSLYSSSSLSR